MEFVAPTRYTEAHHAQDGSCDGELSETHTPVHIRNSRRPQGAYDYQLQMSHPNLLPSLLYHEERKRMVFHRYTQTLRQYLDATNVSPLVVNALRDMNDQPREQISSVSFLYRRVVREIVQFVTDYHENNFVLKEFDMRNLVVCGDTVKFLNVGFVPGQSVEARSRNFACLYRVIFGEIFGAAGDRIPAELKSLKDLIRKFSVNPCYKEKDGKVDATLLKYHLAIMSPSEVLSFVVACRDRAKRLQKSAEKQYESVLWSMTDCKNWNESFTRPEGTKLYPFDACLYPDENDDENNKKDDKNKRKPKKYQFKGPTKVVAEEMLRCLRNIVVHVQDYAPLLRDKTRRKFTDADIERMLLKLFPMQLCKLQRLMYEEGILELFVK